MDTAKRKALVVFVCVLGAGVARADDLPSFHNLCNGGGVIHHPKFINVYWGITQNSYDPSLAVTEPADTTDRIDAFLGALVHSQYFQGVEQYNIEPPFTMGPSIFITPATCPVPIPQTVGDQHNDGKEAHGLADALATCILSQHHEIDPDHTILNLILPSSTQPITTEGWCPGKANADHGWYSGITMTFIPTNSSCSGSFNGLMQGMTHEMVEAATHPRLLCGWVVTAPLFAAGITFFGEEAGDICNGGTVMWPAGPDHINFMNATLGTTAATYWSNKNTGCITGITAAAPTVIPQSVSVIGSGKLMRFQVTGQLDGQPWDLAANQHGNGGGMGTLYVNATISGSHHWSAGNFFRNPREDLVGFRQIAYSKAGGSDVLTVDSFDSFYENYNGGGPSSSKSVAPGDKITFTITGQRSGQSITVDFTAPAATSAANFAVVPPFGSPNGWVFFNDGSKVQGNFVDVSGGPIEGVRAVLKTSAGQSTADAADSFGAFSTKLVTAAAGKQTVDMLSPVKVGLQVDVHPNADSLSADAGDAAGGQPVTLYGSGFAAGNTSVFFTCGLFTGAGAAATNVQVLAKGTQLKFLTPPAPCGPVAVAVFVLVGDAISLPLSYLYVVPDQPILVLNPVCPPIHSNGMLLNDLLVEAYQANGTKSTEQIQLSSPYAAYAGGATTIQIAANTTTSLLGVGPVTAQPVNKPTLKVTQTFVQPPAEPCTWPKIDHLVTIQFPGGGGPVESTVVKPVVQEKFGIAGWLMPAVARGSYAGEVQLSTPEAARLAPTVSVRALGTADLARLITQHPFVLSGRQARLTGTAFTIRSTTDRSGRLLPLQGRLPVPGGADAEVVWLGEASGASWLPVHTSNRLRGTLSFAIQAAGTYSLVTRSPLRSAPIIPAVRLPSGTHR
jgi:hypothetical protein